MSPGPDEPQDRPEVTVVDPRTGESVRADVVGDDRERHRLPSWVAPPLVGALLAVVAVPPAATWVRDERRADRAAAVAAQQRAAERVIDDSLQLLVTAPRIFGQLGESGTRELHVLLALLSTGDRGLVVDGVELVGGLAAATEKRAGKGPIQGGGEPGPTTLSPGARPLERGVVVRVDCTRAADALRTGGPALALSVVVRATPRSGRQQTTEPVPVPEAEVRAAVSQACGPEEEAEDVPLTARVAIVDDGLVVTVRSRSASDVTVLGHRGYGFTLRSRRPVPFVLRPGQVLSSDVDVVRLADCANPEVGGVAVLHRARDGSTEEVYAEFEGDNSALQELGARVRRATC